MPKGAQNGFQNSKSFILFEKGEHARNYYIYNRKRGSGHLEMHENRNKIYAKSMPEKGMEKHEKWCKNEAKMDANIYNKCKNKLEKGMPKIMP